MDSSSRMDPGFVKSHSEPTFTSPLSPRGEIGRCGYLLVGVGLFFLKFALDSSIAGTFGRDWSPANYWPGSQWHMWSMGTADDRLVYIILTAAAVPFIWVGVCLTVKRLRSAGLPLWLVLLFFAPIINIVFISLLCVSPGRRMSGPAYEVASSGTGLRMGTSGTSMRILAPLVTVLIGTALSLFDVYALGVYGFGLFIGLPFCLGMISALIVGLGGVRSAVECVGMAIGSVFCISIALLAIGFEGALCLLMAAPLWLGCAALGGWVGYFLQQHTRDQKEAALLILVLTLVAPVVMGAEAAVASPPRLSEVRTAVVVNAAPTSVWNHVVAFPDLPPPKEWLFRAGIAYPIGATIVGRGVGAERRCRFSTGDFVEPIETWDEPRLLQFAVTSNPPPMRELSFHDHVHPPHLDGFLLSRRGQFRLVETSDGLTLLEGTTWYEHRMWPESYWRWWSDYILHRIHLRVLSHIQNLAEDDMRLASAPKLPRTVLDPIRE